MKKIILPLVLLTAFLFACNDDEPLERDTLDFFQRNLSGEMSLREVEVTFGKPDEDVGSGIHIFVYNLSDGTNVMIGITDVLLYARHVDEQGNVLQELI